MLHELREMGIEGGEPGYLGVTASLTQEEAYRVVYGSRLASRLLRTLATFSCYDDNELYDKASRFNWKALIRPGQTFKINATVSDSGITHSQYAMLRLKDAVVDSLRDESGTRPDVDRDNPDIRIDLFLRQDQATLSLYYSDGVLHRRGYRKQAVEAPIKENLAAAMLRFAGWKGQKPLHDFFCGSGTILLEAAMLASNTPAGFFRERQGFENLPDFSQEAWDKVKTEMDSKIVPLPSDLLFGYDIDSKSVNAARINFQGTPFAASARITQGDFAKLEGEFADGFVITNPPYGVRLGDSESEALRKLYESFGRFLKTHCPGAKVCVLIPEERFEREIWFKPEKRLFLDNGALEVCACLYKILEKRAPRDDRAS